MKKLISINISRRKFDKFLTKINIDILRFVIPTKERKRSRKKKNYD